MMLHDGDVASFKKWVLPKLEIISDADGEVLADYVIALVTGNDSEANIRRNCLEALSDFLQQNTKPFVDQLVQALKNKSYLVQASNPAKPTSTTAPPAPIPSIVGNSNTSYESRNSPSNNTPPVGAPTGPAATRGNGSFHRVPDRPSRSFPQTHESKSSRKRKLVERDQSETREGHDSHYNRTNGVGKQAKQATRNFGKNGRGGQAGSSTSMMPTMPNFPPPPPGLPPFDLSNPMAVMAMMSVLGQTMPGMPQLPSFTPAQHIEGFGSKEKCEDYHLRGFCAAGSLCPKQHGETAPREHLNRTKPNRARSSLSQRGGYIDRTNTTLVIEQIPEANFSEDQVRNFFAEFGTIDEIEMMHDKRIALVKYQDNASASRAYHSPKAVFENRFVKVYWRKTDFYITNIMNDTISDVEMGDDGSVDEVLDLEEIAKRQAEAQKAFEERRRKQEEADARAAEIEEQLREKDEEMRNIRKQLAQIAAGQGSGATDEEFSQTLATLQAEAETLFAQNESEPSVGVGRGYPPRGGYRGRAFGSFSPRGRGFSPSFPPRGGFRGRGAIRGGFSAVKRLDNRPRRLAVSEIVKGSQTDEALRQFLVNNPECTNIGHHPEQPDTLILSFEERYQAEAFLDSSRSIPDINHPLDISWIPNDAFTSLSSTTTNDANDSGAESDGTLDGNREAENSESATAAELHGADADADMDVADDVDRWL